MSGQLSLNLGPKEYALLPKPIGKEGQNPGAEAEAAKAAGPEKDSGLAWKKVVSNTNKDGELQLSFNSDSVSLRTSTVALPTAVKAPSAMEAALNKMKKKLFDGYCNAYERSVNSNRLMGKVGEFQLNLYAGMLMRMGVSPQELQAAREEMREKLITQLDTNMRQVFYDSAFLEVVG